jgi:hypothetical protein
VAVASVAVAFVAVAFMAVAFAAVGDPYNQSVYQGSAGYNRPVGWANSALSGSWRLLLWFD